MLISRNYKTYYTDYGYYTRAINDKKQNEIPTPTPPIPVINNSILLEDGGLLLEENGEIILTEQ